MLNKEIGLELEFDSDTSLQQIYNELINYAEDGIYAFCTFKGEILDNANIPVLTKKIVALKYNVNFKEYEELSNKIAKLDKKVGELYSLSKMDMFTNYFLNRAYNAIDENRKDFFIDLCAQFYNKYSKEKKVIANFFAFASKILIAIYSKDRNKKEINNLLDEIVFNINNLDCINEEDKNIFLKNLFTFIELLLPDNLELSTLSFYLNEESFNKDLKNFYNKTKEDLLVLKNKLD